MSLTSVEIGDMQPSQAFWFAFSDQEIPRELLRPHSNLLSKISSRVTRKVKASADESSSRSDLCIVIPAKFVKHLGIGRGDSVTVTLHNNRLILEKRES